LFLIFFVHGLTHASNVTGSSVVNCAVAEGLVHVIDEFLTIIVFVLFHLILYGLEIHGFLDYGGVVIQTQGHWIYRSSKEPRVLLPRQVLQYAPSSFFPVRIDRVALWHLRYLKRFNGVGIITSILKVATKVWILFAELFKLCVRDWFVVTILS
jgi:hypothetical protein